MTDTKTVEHRTACAHSYVYNFSTPMAADFTQSDYWVCLHCGIEFIPLSMAKWNAAEARRKVRELLKTMRVAKRKRAKQRRRKSRKIYTNFKALEKKLDELEGGLAFCEDSASYEAKRAKIELKEARREVLQEVLEKAKDEFQKAGNWAKGGAHWNSGVNSVIKAIEQLGDSDHESRTEITQK